MHEAGHALPRAADAVVVYETLPLEDEQVSRIGMSRPHPSLGKLEMTQMTHASLGKLEMTQNDSSKSRET